MNSSFTQDVRDGAQILLSVIGPPLRLFVRAEAVRCRVRAIDEV